MDFTKPEFVTKALWFVVLMAAVLAFSLIVYIMVWSLTYPGAYDIIADHAAAVAGLPICAIGSFLLVSLLKVGQEPIKIEGLSFKFEGAAGPVVLWIFCFLAMASAVKMLY